MGKYRIIAGSHRVNFEDENGTMVGANKQVGEVVEDTKNLAKLYPEKFVAVNEAVEEEEAAEEAANLDAHTVPQLKQMAEDLGISLDGITKKTDIIKAITDATK